MKKTILLALASVVTFAFAGQPNKTTKTESVKVTVKESSLKWHATKVTGEHFGDVPFESGEILLSGNALTGGTFNVDMASLTDTDMQGEYKTKLENHLKSEDFFATEKFKTAVLKIKSAQPIAGAAAGSSNYNILADLTIKGITKEVSFPAFVVITNEKVIANADFKINRVNYDIKYGSKSFFEDLGNKAIDDEFNIKVRIIGLR